MNLTFSFFNYIYLFPFVLCFFNVQQENDLELLINACRNSGMNPTLIFSGRVEIESSFRPYGTEGELQRAIDKRFSDAEKIFSKEKIQRMKESMLLMEREGIRNRHHVLFKGNEPFQGKRLSEIRSYNPITKQWADVKKISFGHGNPNFPESCEFLYWEPISRRASITENFTAVPEFHRFGRIQGRFANEAIDILLSKTSRNKFVFPTKGVDAFRKFLNDSGFVINNVGEKKYDDGAVSSVIEIKKDEKLIGRICIDISKGYICPLIEYFDVESDSAEELKSSDYFLHKESGLWFPVNHSQKFYKITTGKTAHSFSYKLNPETLNINQAVSDDEFCVNIPVGGKVEDNRRSRNRHYVANESGTLSLAKGGLDLDRMSWLRTTDGDVLIQQAVAERTVVMQIILISLGIALIFLSIYLRIRNRTKKR
jgi:hypothetical protein